MANEETDMTKYVQISLLAIIAIVGIAIAGTIGDYLARSLGTSVNSTFGADLLTAVKGSFTALSQLLVVFAIAIIAITLIVYLFRNMIRPG